jgi:organic radical activating enzyme
VRKELFTRVDKSITKNGNYLPLVEEFYSIQGEGFHSGKAAYFIRVGGCDIACHWCDSKLSWNEKLHPLVSIDEIVNKIRKTPAQSVVVTGGEPAIYNLEPLSILLRKYRINNFLETSGAYKLTGEWNWVCVSPKKNKEPITENLRLANELKVVIFDDSDFEFAQKWKTKVSETCKLLLQPEYSQFNKMTHKMVDFVKNNPEWNISLQLHKYLNIP